MMGATSISRRGFTLIELLVVISIIALLVAILLPALSKARATARSVLCKQQLKQIGIATTIYTHDFEGVLPPFRAPYPNKGYVYWPVLLSMGYMGKKLGNGRYDLVFLCPADPVQYDPSAFYQGSTGTGSYGAGNTFMPGLGTNETGWVSPPRRIDLVPTDAVVYCDNSNIKFLNEPVTKPAYYPSVFWHPAKTVNAMFIDTHVRALNDPELRATPDNK